MYDERAAQETERIYLTPEMARQRIRTLEALDPKTGEHVLDVGCGPGLLVNDIARTVGSGGHVTGIDVSPHMLALARRRCEGLTQVSLYERGVEDIADERSHFDAATCTQVLLYVRDVPHALAAIYNALKPGGRVVIIETDWRSVLFHSSNDALTHKMLAAWDSVVPSPHLPARLGLLLREQGFAAIRLEALPILNTGYAPDNFSAGMAGWITHYAQEQGVVEPSEATEWLDDLRRLSDAGTYLFCVNRFIFSAVKV